MSYIELAEPPKREERLKACIAYGGTLCGLAKSTGCTCRKDGERSFSQGSICLLLPALAIINSFPDNVVLVHGALGCGACSHSQNANTRSGRTARGEKIKDGVWLSTALSEIDVINGGEKKLQAAIIEADQQYHPKTITVVAACVPGIIGDDIDSSIELIQDKVKATIIPIHCEGFKTKIWATAYDAVYHGLGRTLFKKYEKKEKRKNVVNLFNVSSMGRVDEVELIRLLKLLGMETNVFPVFSKQEDMEKITTAAVSISTCPTHDDYFLKYLKEEFDVPYLLKHMPIGIENTRQWIREIATYLKIENTGEEVIEKEERELLEALKPYKEFFKGKKVFVSAGEFRALATANLLAELGFEIIGIRSFHHDEFAISEYEKLRKKVDENISFNVANCQPYEEANLLKKLKPDLFLGHWNGNSTASKLGIPSHVIYNTGLSYIGYKGVYELARRLHKQLSNPTLYRNLSQTVHLPYKNSWYEKEAFYYLKGGKNNA